MKMGELELARRLTELRSRLAQGAAAHDPAVGDNPNEDANRSLTTAARGIDRILAESGLSQVLLASAGGAETRTEGRELKVKIESDGTPGGTRVLDRDTEEPITNVLAVSFEITGRDGATATITVPEPEVEYEGDAQEEVE